MTDFRKRTTTQDSVLRVAMEKSDTPRHTIITYNWADKTTWYSNATRITDEIATDSGDHITYELSNKSVIDTYHGKITNEDFLVDDDGYSYRVVVKVNDEIKTEQDPHYGTGGDFTVSYGDGYVDFLSALNPADVVKVSYHYAGDSTFTIKPNPGKMLKIDIVEIQFSADVEIRDSVIHQGYGDVEIFAPQYCPTPYPAGTPIPLGDATVFKTMQDYMNDAIRSYPTYPPLGGASWRGLQQETIIMDWDYRSSIVLHDAYGMFITVALDHHEEFGGSYATATFYCKEEDDSAL